VEKSKVSRGVIIDEQDSLKEAHKAKSEGARCHSASHDPTRNNRQWSSDSSQTPLLPPLIWIDIV
jgi:hypothetical protein